MCPFHDLLHVSDGSCLHELRLVCGKVLKAEGVQLELEPKLVRSRHHRGQSMQPADPRVKLQHSSEDTDSVSVCWHLSLQFFPKTAPAGGGTVVTLCGWEFQSPLRPAIISGKTHIVTVGANTDCAVLPPQSNSQM